MISIISPAKSMNFDPVASNIFFTELEEFDETKKLLTELKTLSKVKLKRIMKISDKLAELNFLRYQKFESLPAKQAILAYDGDVYSNIDKKTFMFDSGCQEIYKDCLDQATATYAVEQVGCVGFGALGWTIVGGALFVACEAAANYHLYINDRTCRTNLKYCK